MNVSEQIAKLSSEIRDLTKVARRGENFYRRILGIQGDFVMETLDEIEKALHTHGAGLVTISGNMVSTTIEGNPYKISLLWSGSDHLVANTVSDGKVKKSRPFPVSEMAPKDAAFAALYKYGGISKLASEVRSLNKIVASSGLYQGDTHEVSISHLRNSSALKKAMKAFLRGPEWRKYAKEGKLSFRGGELVVAKDLAGKLVKALQKVPELKVFADEIWKKNR